jgi:hypothetical protein
LRLRIGGQNIPVIYPRMVSGQHIGFHPVQIRQRVQATGVDERLRQNCLAQPDYKKE